MAVGVSCGGSCVASAIVKVDVCCGVKVVQVMLALLEKACICLTACFYIHAGVCGGVERNRAGAEIGCLCNVRTELCSGDVLVWF